MERDSKRGGVGNYWDGVNSGRQGCYCWVPTNLGAHRQQFGLVQVHALVVSVTKHGHGLQKYRYNTHILETGVQVVRLLCGHMATPSKNCAKLRLCLHKTQQRFPHKQVQPRCKRAPLPHTGMESKLSGKALSTAQAVVDGLTIASPLPQTCGQPQF